MTHRIKAFIGNSIYDKNGHLALFQLPNFPLMVFFAASIFARLFSRGLANTLFKTLAIVSIITWALLEIFDGVNYFRRVLGLIILCLSIMTAVVFVRSL